ncbi:hypothetical protein GCM10022399_08950 [Terrabacter ginsenosidimutans]|uniref:Alpha/beta hydrolase n=1 Tax=Terrabacter ginsenosidimutans TaxID=490575 RepID=A0ABP7CUN4_9MICO
MSDRTFIFLHGAGGPIDSAEWLSCINRRLTDAGGSPIGLDGDVIIAPEYLETLMTDELEDEPPATWKRPADRDFVDARVRFAATGARLSERLRFDEAARGGMHWGHVPDDVAELGVNTVIQGWPEIRRYAFRKRSRWAAQRKVLQELPSRGSLVIIAHSLGSVMAVDLLKKLPRSTHVDLLITIGSPLSIPKLGTQMHADEFPVDRVSAWVNLYDPKDVITVGRGVGTRFPSATDLQVRTDGQHDAIGYLSNPVLGEVLARRLYDTQEAPRQDLPARQLHSVWNSLLLQFAYSQQISRHIKADDWKARLRVDRAREILAERAVLDAGRARLSDMATGSNGDSPFAVGRVPALSDFLSHPGDLIEGAWVDADLLAPCVGLVSASPFHPFGLKVDEDQRREALEATLNLIRRKRGHLSDREMARVISVAVSKARRAISPDRWPWEGILVGAGVVLLAATGVGIFAAVPAGLAGAAAMTSTLAAFGPGGMAGGIATIAALTGTGAAFTGAGLGLGAAERPSDAQRQSRLVASELVALPTPELRRALTGILAVVWAQRELELKSSAPMIDGLLHDALDALSAELLLHQEIAEGSPETKDLASKRELIERALEWLRDERLLSDPTSRKQAHLASLPEQPYSDGRD